jgi:hypothetical protein
MNPPQWWWKRKSAEESAPAPLEKSEAPAAETTLLEASVVEREYFAQVQVTLMSSRSRWV